jgi:signal transduction histidine kinase
MMRSAQFAAEAARGDLRRSSLNAFLDLVQDATALNLHCEPGLVMDGYPGPFGQVLMHLVVNALTHAFPDGLDGTIDIATSAAGARSCRVASCRQWLWDGAGNQAAGV